MTSGLRSRGATLCFALSLALALPACKGLDRKSENSSLLIVKAQIELRKKIEYIRKRPAFEFLNIVSSPFDQNEPIPQSHRKSMYYVFADVPAGTYTVSSGYFRLVKYDPNGPTTAQVMLKDRTGISLHRESPFDFLSPKFELGVSVPWKDEVAQAATTDAHVGGVHYMGDYRIVLHFAGRASTYPAKTEVTGEKTETGERLALEFLLREWPGSPWEDSIRAKLAAASDEGR